MNFSCQIFLQKIKFSVNFRRKLFSSLMRTKFKSFYCKLFAKKIFQIGFNKSIWDQYYKTIFACNWTAINLWQDFDAMCEMLTVFSSWHICASYIRTLSSWVDGTNLQMQTHLRLIHTRRSGLRQCRDRNFSISAEQRNRVPQTHAENAVKWMSL